MFWRSFANYSLALFLVHSISESRIYPSATTSATNQSAVKVVFILEESQRDDLKTAFNVFLKKNVNSALLNLNVDLEGVIVQWRRKDTPNSTWRKIKENVIEGNASAIVSFLPSWKNQVLVHALSKSDVPIIGIESLTKELYRNNKVSIH